MSAIEAAGSRLDALETRMMQQDQIIDDLNATITGQWRLIDVLRRQMAALEERVRDLNDARVAPTEPPPPHY